MQKKMKEIKISFITGVSQTTRRTIVKRVIVCDNFVVLKGYEVMISWKYIENTKKQFCTISCHNYLMNLFQLLPILPDVLRFLTVSDYISSKSKARISHYVNLSGRVYFIGRIVSWQVYCFLSVDTSTSHTHLHLQCQYRSPKTWRRPAVGNKSLPWLPCLLSYFITLMCYSP